MIPIFEQGGGRGMGYDVQSFFERFDDICHDHKADGRAKAFAFIFYDFKNQEFSNVLQDQAVLVKLNSLIGSDLSVFFLHACGQATNDHFNTEFLSRLGIQENLQLPCVVFFHADDKKITDIAVRHLESPDLIHGFFELYQIFERQINGMEGKEKNDMSLKLIRGLKFVGVEAFKASLNVAFTKMLQNL